VITIEWETPEFEEIGTSAEVTAYAGQWETPDFEEIGTSAEVTAYAGHWE
jgi:coenzyme PQQ precursor peptide PqqA